MATIETLPPASKSERRHAVKKYGKEIKVLKTEIAKRMSSKK
jgi:hypothetical protein